jgi:hypothetical protein
MKLSRETLIKYAAVGVRERLREMQRELDGLARDFPELVKNADGSMPSVVPLVTKKSAAPKKAAAPARPSKPNGRSHDAHHVIATSRRPSKKRRLGKVASKLAKQRQASADVLEKFDTTTPRKIASRKIGSLVRRGYLETKGKHGYIRTAKRFYVNPSEATAN